MNAQALEESRNRAKKYEQAVDELARVSDTASLKSKVVSLELSENNAKKKIEFLSKKLQTSEVVLSHGTIDHKSQELQKEMEVKVSQLEQEIISLVQQMHSVQ